MIANIAFVILALLLGMTSAYKDYCPTSFDKHSSPHLLQDVAQCIQADGKTAPCAPGNQMCPPGPFGRASPQFHVRDLSCGENDPNGPVFDPVHGVVSISTTPDASW